MEKEISGSAVRGYIHDCEIEYKRCTKAAAELLAEAERWKRWREGAIVACDLQEEYEDLP
jgi:hypothetical protein